jgi:hypothetical protein
VPRPAVTRSDAQSPERAGILASGLLLLAVAAVALLAASVLDAAPLLRAVLVLGAGWGAGVGGAACWSARR